MSTLMFKPCLIDCIQTPRHVYTYEPQGIKLSAKTASFTCVCMLHESDPRSDFTRSQDPSHMKLPSSSALFNSKAGIRDSYLCILSGIFTSRFRDQDDEQVRELSRVASQLDACGAALTQQRSRQQRDALRTKLLLYSQFSTLL